VSAGLHVAVVGGGLAALRAAEGVVAHDATARVTVLGAERAAAYARPPLSKAVLAGATDGGELAVRRRPQHQDRITLRYDAPVAGADLARREVRLLAGGTLAWDALVVATGLRPRRLDVPGPSLGRHAVRTLPDVLELRAALARARRRVVVVGAGVLGCEIASTLAAGGHTVTVVDAGTTPMERALGPVAGERVLGLHREHGVQWCPRTTVAACTGKDAVDGVVLSGGAELPADVVVEAVGSTANTGWLDGSGLDLSDGVLADNHLLVGGRPDVAACGDVVRFPNPLFPGVLRRVEHWTMAGETARRAALSVLDRPPGRPATGRHGSPGAAPFCPLPYFWSEQHGLTLHGLGMTDDADDTLELERGPGGHVVYGHAKGGRLVAVTLFGLASRLPHYRELLLRALVPGRA
jgi:NADPH-dependent 2,4-dienoyl-CoA reductase/sulfur reductase-like enzyme